MAGQRELSCVCVPQITGGSKRIGEARLPAVETTLPSDLAGGAVAAMAGCAEAALAGCHCAAAISLPSWPCNHVSLHHGWPRVSLHAMQQPPPPRRYHLPCQRPGLVLHPPWGPTPTRVVLAEARHLSEGKPITKSNLRHRSEPAFPTQGQAAGWFRCTAAPAPGTAPPPTAARRLPQAVAPPGSAPAWWSVPPRRAARAPGRGRARARGTTQLLPEGHGRPHSQHKGAALWVPRHAAATAHQRLTLCRQQAERRRGVLVREGKLQGQAAVVCRRDGSLRCGCSAEGSTLCTWQRRHAVAAVAAVAATNLLPPRP